MLFSFIEKNKKEIFFIILLILFFYRSPFIFSNGRFMAEEGSLYFANAYKFSFFYSLIFVDFTSGYMNLWANLSGIISNFFKLNFAPLISNYLALIPKALIIFLILYNRLLLINRFENKILLCLIIFLTPLNVPEIWLNSINSQIFFCIIAFILFLTIYDSNRISYFHLILIITAGLTGIYSCILLPIFFFKYIIYKKKQDLINFISISICSFLQLSLIVYGKLSNFIYEGKIHSIDLDLLTNYIYNVLVKAFLGTTFTKFIYNNILIDANLYVVSVFTISIFIITFIFSFTLYKKNLQNKIENKFLFFSTLYCFFATSLVVMTGAVANYVGGRYAALPSFYLLITVLFAFIFFQNSKIKYFFLSLLLISIMTGAYEYRPPNQYLNFLDCNDCPNWKEEVIKFKDDKYHLLRIWPYPNKNMSLN